MHELIRGKRDHINAAASQFRTRSIYRMALIFRGSKFSRIALREHFVEKNSRIRGKTPRPHNGRGVLYSPDTALEDFRAR